MPVGELFEVAWWLWVSGIKLTGLGVFCFVVCAHLVQTFYPHAFDIPLSLDWLVHIMDAPGLLSPRDTLFCFISSSSSLSPALLSMDCNSVLAQRMLSYVYAGGMVVLWLVVMGSMLACCFTCLFIYCIRRKKKRKEDEKRKKKIKRKRS